MKKLSFISFVIIMLSYFMTSCNESDLDTTAKVPDTEAAHKTKKPSYFTVLKSSSKSENQTKGVGVKSVYWENGDVIKVKFLSEANGTALYRQRVEEYAKLWEKYANITFEFVSSSEPSDVKIGVGYEGSTLSWSYLGTECQWYDDDEITMNLMEFSDAQLDDDATNGDTREDFGGIVLRMFGHVLGLQFEHMNPSNNSSYLKNLNTTETRAYLLRQGWDSMDIAMMLKAYTNTNSIDYSGLDVSSIMMIYFPDYLSIDGSEIGQWNTSLSKGDIAFIGQIYPFPKKKLAITYANDANEYEYEAVRIGEYYWLDCNLHQPANHIPSRNAIDRALDIYLGSNSASYTVSLEDFNRYFGSYYDRATLESKIAYPIVYEYDKQGDRVLTQGWDFGSNAAWRQLFAMCGDGSKAEVKRYLGAKLNDNPCAYNPTGINWFEGNENVYGFNLMPGSSLFNGPQEDGSGKTTGDFDRFFNDDRFIGHNETFVVCPTYNHSRYTIKFWHWMHIRYFRKLTDQELGYKLYVNADQTDIKKLSLTEAAPSGYTELGNGHLRGLYVQYILDNPNPEKTIAEIKQMAYKLDTNFVF